MGGNFLRAEYSVRKNFPWGGNIQRQWGIFHGESFPRGSFSVGEIFRGGKLFLEGIFRRNFSSEYLPGKSVPRSIIFISRFFVDHRLKSLYGVTSGLKSTSHHMVLDWLT